ncbi:MAG: hypothetical protein MI723_14830, partial [Caulobacterales bacterium]|nr:hypothetical protein [Caulobacterales bacterium]
MEAAGVASPPGAPPVIGRSFLGLLAGAPDQPPREAVFAGRERHSSARWGNRGYPQRSVRTAEHLYIRNFAAERWPAGAPRKLEEDGALGPSHGAYHDIDAAPSLDVLIEGRDDPALAPYLALAVAHRPAEELYDVAADPHGLVNLADDPAYEEVRRELAAKLEAELRATGDPRLTRDDGDAVWESYPRLRGRIRSFPAPDWAGDDASPP